jgi:predicted metal-dependent enzyme (double-stranded beta helix superfamily)
MSTATSTEPELSTAPEAPLRPALLADIACGLAAAEPLWRATVQHDPELRRPVRLLATDRYEVWVIGWTTDQHARLHDHGGSTGAVVVTAGELTEIVPRDGKLIERPLPTGTLRTFPVNTVHDVINRGGQPATSIHVYSPPITAMTYYDTATLEPVETVAVAEEAPVITPKAGSLLLHPSSRQHHGAGRA